MPLTIGKNKINENSKIFIIAEVGSNHDGKLEQAFQLIDIAAEAGADAVKFQIFKADKLYTKNCGIIDFNGKKLDIYKFLKKSEVSYNWIPQLKKYCNKKKIIFFATPFDEKSADILQTNGVPLFKIASPELNHLPLLKHIAKKNKPMIMSDGLNTLSDIDEAIKTVREAGNNQIAILHCLSDYPAPPEEFNLNFLQTLIKVFGVIAGVSDHTLDPILIPTLAVANGAKIIEKHFTINKKLSGTDHTYALEPKELKLMIKKIREIENYSPEQKEDYMSRFPKIMGKYEKIIAPCEQKIYHGDKRSIFSIAPIKIGEKFSKKNIRILRGERFLKPGLHPRYWDIIIGKICQKNINQYQGVLWENIIL